MDDCNPSSTPLPKGLKVQIDMDLFKIDPKHYCSLVGKLIFLMNTIPNITFVVNLLSR